MGLCLAWLKHVLEQMVRRCGAGSRTLALPGEQVRYTVLGPVVWEALPNAKANIMTWMAAGDRAAK